MSKKRDAAESNNDEQKKEDDSGSILEDDDDDAKRPKLGPFKDTTLQDLPIEVLERILIKAVAMEVLELKVARCARKEQADLVIERLGTVSPQWNCVLTTNIFRNEVHSLLEGPETNRFEILDQPSFHIQILKLATLKDEIFLLCRQDDIYRGPTVIYVYDRNNMADVKDIIPLGEKMRPIDMASCNVSNCVYVLNHLGYYWPSVFRIKKDEEHKFQVSPWLNNRGLPFACRGPMSVASNGNVIILSSQQNWRSSSDVDRQAPLPGMSKAKPTLVRIFDANGFMQHKMKLSPDIYGFRIIYSVIQKSNGNLVLLAAIDESNAKLLEIDTTGIILRQYQSSLDPYSAMSFADVYGRILVTDYRNRIKLFDPLFNPLEIAYPTPSGGFLHHAPQIHFNSERNEIVRLEKFKYFLFGCANYNDDSVLNFFRLISE